MEKTKTIELFRTKVILLLNKYGLAGSIDGAYDIYEEINKMWVYYDKPKRKVKKISNFKKFNERVNLILSRLKTSN